MIELNRRNGKPIYEQVKDSLRRMILSGAIVTDEKLPSVRQLASSLAVNPNTIQRAVEALEKEGYVYSVPGKGSFAAGWDSAGAQRKQELLQKFDALAEELRLLGVTTRELIARYEQREGEHT